MRVSVTLSEEINQLINEHSKTLGISKDKCLGMIINQYYTDGFEKKHNERGAGRKQEYTEEHAKEMKAYRLEGYSYRAIADIFHCGVGTVHKLINEQNK